MVWVFCVSVLVEVDWHFAGMEPLKKNLKQNIDKITKEAVSSKVCAYYRFHRTLIIVISCTAIIGRVLHTFFCLFFFVCLHHQHCTRTFLIVMFYAWHLFNWNIFGLKIIRANQVEEKRGRRFVTTLASLFDHNNNRKIFSPALLLLW